MYDGRIAGGVGGTDYIQILAGRAGFAFAGFTAVNAAFFGLPGWQWGAVLAALYIVCSFNSGRRSFLPPATEFLLSLALCGGLTYLGMAYCEILYHLLLIRMAFRVGWRRIRRMALLTGGTYLAACGAAAFQAGNFAAGQVAYNLLGMMLAAYTAARLDRWLARHAGDDKQMLELIRQNDRNYRMALTDALTGLYNHRAYKEKIDGLAQYVLLIIDIDHFKNLNDTYGHLVGDKVLVTIGNIIKLGIRSGDMAFRYGGEEFAIVLPGTTTQMGLRIAERLKQRVEEWKFEDDLGRIPVTISIGLADKRTGMSSQAVFEQADRCLYRAKQLGRNNIQSCAEPDGDGALKYSG